jgi:hypothetical protein
LDFSVLHRQGIPRESRILELVTASSLPQHTMRRWSVLRATPAGNVHFKMEEVVPVGIRYFLLPTVPVAIYILVYPLFWTIPYTMMARFPRYFRLCGVFLFFVFGQIVLRQKLSVVLRIVGDELVLVAAQTPVTSLSPDVTHMNQTIPQSFARDWASKPQGSAAPSYLNPPNQTNTVVAIINMHRSNKKVQRLVCSIRRRGDWDGPVLVITDTDELVQEYTQVFSKHCGPVYVAQAVQEDLAPTDPSGTTMIKYKKKAMLYKRFKNLVWDYLEKGVPSSLEEEIEYILYVDSDNVIGDSLQEFLTGSYQTILYSTGLSGPPGYDSSVYQPPNLKLTNMPPPKLDMGVAESFFTTFPQGLADGGTGGRIQYHGGLMLNHRHYSRFCLDSWKAAFDDTENPKFNRPLDQLILVEIPEYTNYKCQIHLISDAVMTFPTPEDAQNHTLNTFVHFTRYREQELRKDRNVTQHYLLDLLGVDPDDASDDPMILDVFGSSDDSLMV